MIEEARVTPSHPVVSLLVGLSHCTIPFSRSFNRPPLSVLVFGFQAVKSKPGQGMSPGIKDEEGREEGVKNRLGKTWGWECGGCWRGFIGLDWRLMALPKYCVIHQNPSDVSGFFFFFKSEV